MSTPHFHATVLTLFPEMFPGPLGHSLIGKALESGIWSLDCINIRDFGVGKHQTVDDTPYGGGAGMVMLAEVLDAAIAEAFRRTPDATLIYFSPRGEHITQPLCASLAGLPVTGLGLTEEEKALPHKPKSIPPSLILLCGRYEAIDERIIEKHQPLEVSLGDFVMTGGELAAMALLDACIRLLPGVVGEPESLASESFGMNENYALLLEHPHYSRPPTWEGMAVPEVLLSGHHAKVEQWRLDQSEHITKARRPDLWQRYMQRKKS